MSGLDLGKQIGPLPAGAWIAVVGTGLGIAYYSRNAQAGSVDDGSTVVDDTSTQDGVGTGVNGNWIDVTPTPPTTTGDGTAQDNDEWGKKAIDYLVGAGYDPAIAQSAIAKALQGIGMSAQEWVMWKTAILHTGAPPYPLDTTPYQLQPIPGPSTPVKKPPVKAPVKHHRIYTIQKTDTLASISKKMYGNTLHATAIFNANRKGVKRTPWLSHPGFLVSGDRGKPGLRNAGRNLLIP